MIKKHFSNLFHHFFHRIAMLGIIEYENCHVGNTGILQFTFCIEWLILGPRRFRRWPATVLCPDRPWLSKVSQAWDRHKKKTWILMDFCNKRWKMMFNYIAYYTKPHQNIPSCLASRDLQYLVMTFQPKAAWAKSSWFRRDLSPSYGLWCDDRIKGIAVSSGCMWIDFGSSHIADPLWYCRELPQTVEPGNLEAGKRNETNSSKMEKLQEKLHWRCLKPITLW